MNIEYEIKPVKTSKDQVKQPEIVTAGVLPPLSSVIVIIGQSGSGKSVLLHNLISDEKFYKDCFDKVMLISPTGSIDDVQKALHVKPSMNFTDLDEAIGALKVLETIQKELVEKKGNAKAPKIAVVCDDCIGHPTFMKSQYLTELFIKCRHYNVTLFFLSQYYKRLPPVLRNQASLLCFFAVSSAEAEQISEAFAPPDMPANNFKRMIYDAVKEKYSFFTIAKRSPYEQRYRRGLAMVIDLDLYRDKKKTFVEDKNKTSNGEPLQETDVSTGTKRPREGDGSDATSTIKRQTRPI